MHSHLFDSLFYSQYYTVNHLILSLYHPVLTLKYTHLKQGFGFCCKSALTSNRHGFGNKKANTFFKIFARIWMLISPWFFYLLIADVAQSFRS